MDTLSKPTCKQFFKRLDEAGLSDLYQMFVNADITLSIVWELDDDELKSTGVNLIQQKKINRVAVKKITGSL